MNIEFEKININTSTDMLRKSIPERYATTDDITWLWDNVKAFLDKTNMLWKKNYSDMDLAGEIKDEISGMLDKVIDLKVKKAEFENKQEKTRDELEVEKRNFMQKFWKKIMQSVSTGASSSKNNNKCKADFISLATAGYEESFGKLLKEVEGKEITIYSFEDETYKESQKKIILGLFCDFFSKEENQTAEKYQDAGRIILDIAYAVFVQMTEYRNQQEILFLNSLVDKLERNSEKETE